MIEMGTANWAPTPKTQASRAMISGSNPNAA